MKRKRLVDKLGRRKRHKIYDEQVLFLTSRKMKEAFEKYAKEIRVSKSELLRAQIRELLNKRRKKVSLKK